MSVESVGEVAELFIESVVNLQIYVWSFNSINYIRV